MKNKKKIIINLIILALVIGVTSYYLFKDGGLSKLATLSSLKLGHILLLLGVVVFIFLIEGIIIMMASKGIKKLNFVEGVGAYSCGNLGSNISPLKSMHYPALFYYFNKKGMSFEDSLANTTKCSIVYGSATTIIYTILFIICHINKFTIEVNGLVIYVELATLIGWLFNVFQIIFYLTLAYNERIHKWFVNVVSNILFKFKRISDKEEYKQVQALKMRVFKEQIQYFFKHALDFLTMVFCYMLRVLVFGSISYILYLMLTGAGFDFHKAVLFFTLYQASTYLANIVPTPGGSGGFEVGFTLAYSTVIDSKYLTGMLVIYRCITYFIPVIVEAIVFSIVVFRRKKQEFSTAEIEKEAN